METGWRRSSYVRLNTKARDVELFIQQNPNIFILIIGRQGKKKREKRSRKAILLPSRERKSIQEKGRKRLGRESPWKKGPDSFRRDKVKNLFDRAMEVGKFRLPEPNEVGKTSEPNYCPDHRMWGHTIEDCWIFKDIMQGMIQRGEIELSASVRVDPPHHNLTVRRRQKRQ